MSVETLSIGNDLKDSFKITDKWIGNGINWLIDIDEFYRERAAIEKEYSNKLKELCKKHFEKKAKNSSHLSVGDEPQVTPGSLESASLVMWNEALTQTELIADEKALLSKEFQSKVGDNLVTLKSRCMNIRSQIVAVHDNLKLEKTKVEDDVTKSKKHYDSLCSSTESARQKTEKSLNEKHERKLHEKEVEMNIGKNDYLMKINIANRNKDKFYYQDIPEVLDYFQELNESRVALVNKVLKNASIIERNSNDRIKEKLFTIDSTIDQNNPKLDTAMFIKHNIIDWKEPSDFYFIPCDIWHDDESLVTKSPEIDTLKKILNQSSNDYSRLEESCLQLKQRLEESVADRHKDKDNLTLKFDNKLSTSIRLLLQFMNEDNQRVKHEVIIELIQNFAGDQDLSYQEQVKVKKSKFGFLKKNKSSSAGATNEDGGSDTHSLHTVKSNHSQKTIGSNSGLFSLRRNRGKSNASSIGNGNGNGNSNGDVITGTALYQYDATGDDEASLSPGEQFTVIDEDDGSGWTMIHLNNGSEGLVPTSYIQVQKPSPSTTTTPKKSAPPAVAPKRGAKRVQYVQALYSYTADGDDEISIGAGDKIVLIQEDTDGSGWTEGELNGNRGLFPSSYVQKV